MDRYLFVPLSVERNARYWMLEKLYHLQYLGRYSLGMPRESSILATIQTQQIQNVIETQKRRR